jgi:hypothetical protein
MKETEAGQSSPVCPVTEERLEISTSHLLLNWHQALLLSVQGLVSDGSLSCTPILVAADAPYSSV